jgi:hypothetical protein
MFFRNGGLPSVVGGIWAGMGQDAAASWFHTALQGLNPEHQQFSALCSSAFGIFPFLE